MTLLLALMLQAPAGPLPPDVAAYVARRDECDHLRGEEPYDAARAADLARRLAATCKGADARLAALKRKYAANARVRARLAHYDPVIE